MTDTSPLFPPLEPFDRRNLAVDGGHTLYVEQCGRADGLPAVFLHGGPGSNCQESHRQLFDPALFRAILFDQRGCGLSTPKGSLEANTTQDQIADLEKIRETLGIDRWMVVGGSWGATLAVAYAETHPERVTGIVLRAVFLGSEAEWDWAFAKAAPLFHPGVWQQLLDFLPDEERDDPLAAYGARIGDSDPAIHRPAAWIWHDYERILSALAPEPCALPESFEAAAKREGTPGTPYIEWHYQRHGFFLEPGQLLGEAHRLKDIPGIIVQGRYDLLCPPHTAFALSRNWGNCECKIIANAGHSISESGVLPSLVTAISQMGRNLS
ncbi:MAG: prolyl aminopeptidase [Rhodospirillaceae bacterium]|jgi:proline iminopeptidase|nr:prolyl aminopeptidase [Rhodospirillaceae bacterium]MBT5373583.1 prolyl aminopeptidase [Rhodospirillaceae bacterium]MBT5659911.1 prolyl aminopeptidase [Rhodospirillaceae bacterium]MBT5753205.1 prolyl aminopeptidase [Rhodospirillaceae bacterium]